MSQLIDELWKNSKDSMEHAIEHFLELTYHKDNKWHHQKWIILSVHHAAECVVNMLLKEIDPSNRIFFKKDGSDHFPSLIPSINELIKYERDGKITKTEVHLLNLLEQLNKTRNEIIHRNPPQKLDASVVSVAAMSLIGMLHVIQRRRNESFYNIFNQHTEVQRDISEAVKVSMIDEYKALIESLLKEKYPNEFFDECPYCGAVAIINSLRLPTTTCNACFEELELITCESCKEEYYTLSYCNEMIDCPFCG
ncbi:MAG: hypothetical protein AB7S75_15245 [Desulfococcaceae bacterium]